MGSVQSGAGLRSALPASLHLHTLAWLHTEYKCDPFSIASEVDTESGTRGKHFRSGRFQDRHRSNDCFKTSEERLQTGAGTGSAAAATAIYTRQVPYPYMHMQCGWCRLIRLHSCLFILWFCVFRAYQPTRCGLLLLLLLLLFELLFFWRLCQPINSLPSVDGAASGMLLVRLQHLYEEHEDPELSLPATANLTALLLPEWTIVQVHSFISAIRDGSHFSRSQ